MTNFLHPIILIAACVWSFCSPAQVREAAAKSDSDITGLTDTQIVSGLKEALELSTNKAVAITGKHDGFLKNESIRILLPPKLQAVGKSMRLLGMGEQVDDLEIGMNRAAEQAAPQAKPIFLAALRKMTFHDARLILSGGDTAATEYFRSAINDDLTAAFTPIVHHSLQKVGVVHQYNQVIKTAPGGSALANEFDLDKYVVEKTLDGIFYELGVEESQIRHDPGSQATDLLKEVFARK